MEVGKLKGSYKCTEGTFAGILLPLVGKERCSLDLKRVRGRPAERIEFREEKLRDGPKKRP